MNHRIIFISCWILTVAVSGCTAAIKPAMKQQTDQMLGRYQSGSRVVAAPQAPRMKPWRTGQWVVYRDKDSDGNNRYVKNSIVAEDACGIWLEQEIQDYYGRTITKTCYSSMPAVLAATEQDVGNRISELMQVIVTKSNDAKPVVMDFRTETGRMQRMLLGSMGMGEFTGSIRLQTDKPQQDIATTAGEFEKTYVTEGMTRFGPVRLMSDIWFHPEVPVSGIVRSVTGDGKYTRELLDYGEEGAQSALLDLP